MTIYSTLLAYGQVADSDSVLAYTAPAMGTVVVREMTIAAAAGGTGRINVSVLSGSVSTPLWRFEMADGYVTYQWKGRDVLLPGDQVYVAALDGGCLYRVSGYLLGG